MEEALLPSSAHPVDAAEPISWAHRTFSGWDIASVWIGVSVSVSTYFLAGSLVELGMSWWQGLLTVVTANVVQVFLSIFLGHPGTKYGIPFPVLCRASFGTRGAYIPALVRGIIACGWYSIDTWIGAQAVFVVVNALLGGALDAEQVSWLGTTLPKFGCFIVFWLLQLGFILNGVDRIRYLEKYSAPVQVAFCGALLIWAYVKADGFGAMLWTPSEFGEGGAKEGQFWSVFFPALTANIGSLSSISLNMSDFTRHARSQTDQILGHIGLPVFMGAFSFVGLAVTSSTAVIFGEIISNPVILLGKIGGLVPLSCSLIGITLVVLTSNAVNIVAPANVLINMNPSIFSFGWGALLTAVIGIFFEPWRLFQNSETYVNKWLLGYAALTGPLGGIILTDYYILRHCDLDTDALYSSSHTQPYWYLGGFNTSAVVAFLIGAIPCIPGFLYTTGVLEQTLPVLVSIYNLDWFFGFFMAGLSFWALSAMQCLCCVSSKMGQQD